MKETRSYPRILLAASRRHMLWHLFQKKLDLVLVSEYPKSGGTWLSEMLGEAFGIPCPRNIAPKFESCVMHGHHLTNIRGHKFIGLIRDGRDVMVSAYYHFLFENDRNPSFFVEKNRRNLQFQDYHDIEHNLPKFIAYSFEVYAKKSLHFSWSESVRSFHQKDAVLIVRYEDLLKNAANEIVRIADFLNMNITADLDEVVTNHSFAKKKASMEHSFGNSFLRKGVSGDWKNHFSKESRMIFNQYGGHELILANYEKDHNWVDADLSK